METIARATAEYPARRFRLPNKGRIAVGADADLALVALSDETVLPNPDLFYRHQHSPYVGRKLRGRVARTLLRGVTIYRDGQIVSAPIGRLITPQAIVAMRRTKWLSRGYLDFSAPTRLGQGASLSATKASSRSPRNTGAVS